MKTKIALIVLLTVISCLCSPVKIKIIATSDIHGYILPFDLKSFKPSDNSLSQIYTYIREERAKKDQSVILLDNGDVFQGDPIVYYSSFEAYEQPNVVSKAYNYMQYDAVTVGNHDIETGPDVYNKVRREMNMPWLAANAIDIETGQPFFEPYTIIKTGGKKIAVIGLVTPHIPNWLPKSLWEGLEFHDMIESAAYWLKIAKEREKPDLVVGLFHSGVDYTYGGQNKESYKNENAVQLVAERVKGYDIIISGHDHKIWNKLVGNTLIVGPGNHSRTFAVIDVVFEDKLDITAEIKETKSFKPDELFIKHFETDLSGAKEYVQSKIGELTTELTTRNAYFGNSEMVDLIHKIQLDHTKADISFAAILQYDATIKPGDLTISDMFKMYSYENFLYTMKLTGEEIRKHLEFSYNLWINTIKSDEDFLLNFEVDSRDERMRLRNPFYNFDYAAGINYTVNITKEYGSRVVISGFSDGRDFDAEEVYTVVLNSYRGSGGGGHLTLGAGLTADELNSRLLTTTKRDFRKYMIDWIKAKTNAGEKIQIQRFENWSFIPKELVEKRKDKEYKLLFHR